MSSTTVLPGGVDPAQSPTVTGTSALVPSEYRTVSATVTGPLCEAATRLALL